MADAQVHKRTARDRHVRAAKTGTAREAIGTLTPGCEIYCLTFGQFSLIDAIVAILEQTGSADVVLSTWTAAAADLKRAAHLMETASIRSLRMIVDRSFLTRQPAYCETMRHLFGDDCIRTTRSHAKFVLIRNETWQVVVRTSMNLNENPRLENIEISDDATLYAFMAQVTESLFDEQPAGLFNAELPELAAVPNVARIGAIAAGQMARPVLTPGIGRRT